MDVSVSVSLFQDELASTVELAVKAALDSVVCAITEAVGSKFTLFQVEMSGLKRENETLKLRLEISESELKAVRGCINAAHTNIKQPFIFQDPIESHAIPESEAQERLKIEAVYTQEESFEQEWCASLLQVTELPCVKDEDIPEQECVLIKEEFIEQECVSIAEELPTEDNVCTLEKNTKLGSNLCDDSPSECELGFGASKVDEGEHDSTPSPQCKNSSRDKPQCKKHRETTPQEEAAYNSTESQPQVIQTVPMAVLKSTTFYKQRWMVMMVDTAVTCPTDGIAFTEEMIPWNVLPPLVPTPQISTLDVQIGVDDCKLDPATIHNKDYKLDVGPQLITVKIPVGADSGYYKSHVLNNTYVISYSIEPMLEHTWQDGPEKTKYTILHPITTPFMPRPPVVTNIGPETLTVPEANLKGYNIQEHVFPNGSKIYTLQVPFEDPNVKQKVTPPDTRTYILPLTYLLNIVLENTPFTHPAVVEAILQDITPPTVTGYCDGAAFYAMVTYGNMAHNWIPFVGSRTWWKSACPDCFTNGTMAALAVKVESVPSLSPSQLTLRDPSCRPLQSDAINAVFYFNVNSCGTTRRVSIDTL
ncbi:UNVERIFIED_CONTAM: hypothetical protein FKN15_060781 [Acipenser sinensis]